MRGLTVSIFMLSTSPSVVTCKCKCNRLGGVVSLIAFEYCPHYSVVRLWKLNVKRLFHFNFNMAVERSYEYVEMKMKIGWLHFHFEREPLRMKSSASRLAVIVNINRCESLVILLKKRFSWGRYIRYFVKKLINWFEGQWSFYIVYLFALFS